MTHRLFRRLARQPSALLARPHLIQSAARARNRLFKLLLALPITIRQARPAPCSAQTLVRLSFLAHLLRDLRVVQSLFGSAHAIPGALARPPISFQSPQRPLFPGRRRLYAPPGRVELLFLAFAR